LRRMSARALRNSSISAGLTVQGVKITGGDVDRVANRPVAISATPG
jgi:hypothetical protein